MFGAICEVLEIKCRVKVSGYKCSWPYLKFLKLGVDSSFKVISVWGHI